MPVTKNPITVAHVVWSLQVGGLERIVVELVKRLDPSMFASIVCCLEFEGELAQAVRQAGGTVIRFDKRPGRDLGLPFRLASCFRQHRVDIIHCHNYGPLAYGSIAAKLSGGARVIHTVHGPDASMRSEQRFYQRLKLVNQVVAVSEHVREVAIHRGGVPRGRIETILNGIDVDSYATKQTDSRARIRGELGLDGDDQLVGIVARLTPEKDHGTLLRAVARLRESDERVHLALVGDGELREELTRLSERLGIRAHTHFLGTRTDVPDVLSALDVFVLSSKIEGLGITLLEAMAAGVPVIGTAAGGIPEVIADGDTGRLTPVGDPHAMAEAVSWVLSHSDDAARMARRAATLVRERFGFGVMVARYETLYSRLAGR